MTGGEFTYNTAGQIDNIDPNFGQGGTKVSITGSVLRGSGGSVDVVTLAGETASITSQNDTLVVVVAAVSSAKTADVVVEANTGAVTTVINGFTYQTAGNVTSVSPDSGQIGTRVTIAGTSLRGSGSNIATVFLGSAEATIVTQSNVEAVVDAAAGPNLQTAVDVTLTADSGAIVTLTDGFTYLTPGEIQLVEPSRGQVDTEVLIVGSRLCGGGANIAIVSLAGKIATIIDDNCLLLQVKANDLGAQIIGDVVLTSNTGATVTKTNGFEYLGSGNITSVTPSAGQGRTLVTIQGQSLFGGGTKALAVTLGGIAATIQGTATNDTYIVVRANAGPQDMLRRHRVMW